MKKLLITLSGVSLLFFLFSSMGFADGLDRNYKVIERTWQENASGPISTVLPVMVPVLGTDPDGNPSTSIEARFINVTVHFNTPAPLYKGEVESFKIVGAPTGNPQAPDIVIAIESKRVFHRYGQAVDTIGLNAGSAQLRLTHSGRVPSTPPAAFNNVSVDFTTPDEPFELSFFDFALVDHPDSNTSYEFVIKRPSWWFGSEKLIAKGTLTMPEHGGLSKVTITQDSPYD